MTGAGGQRIDRPGGALRKAKIAATLGPASASLATMVRMVRAGLDVARLNFSHGSAADHRRLAHRLRKAARTAGRIVALMADLQGPRFRIGELPGGALDLAAGSRVTLVAGRRRAPAGILPVSYAALARDVRRGDRVLIDDGQLELVVARVRNERIDCEVVRGGRVTDHKGLNVPGGRLSAPALTPKDRRDLTLAVALGADWLAVSFVRRASDVRLARRLVRAAGRDIPILAKIEHPQALDNLPAILAEADGLLVARGDLGVELPPEDVPVLQKQLIEAANGVGKPVITATQMLESMRYARRPTRAEASDVANAVLDGSDCLLLTAETASGKFPVESIETMARIVERAEASGRAPRRAAPAGGLPVPMATCLAGCRAAYEAGASFLVVFTQSGFSAITTARFRPRTPILAFAAGADIARRLQVYWGVRPRAFRPYRTLDQMIRALDRALLAERRVARRDLVVILAGSPLGVSGTTNVMEIHRVGEPSTVAASRGKQQGRARRS